MLRHTQGRPVCGCSPHPDIRPDPAFPYDRWQGPSVLHRYPAGHLARCSLAAVYRWAGTPVHTPAPAGCTRQTPVLAVRNRLSSASRSTAIWAAYSARRRAARALARFARRIQRSTNNATCGPMVSDAMARMSRNSISPILIGLFPLSSELFQGGIPLSFQYSICGAAVQAPNSVSRLLPPPAAFFSIFPAKAFFAVLKYAILIINMAFCTGMPRVSVKEDNMEAFKYNVQPGATGISRATNTKCWA